MFNRFAGLLLLLSVALSFWATVRIVQSVVSGRPKALYLLVSWLLPVVGPLIVVKLVLARSGDAGVATLAVRVDGPAPESLELAGRKTFSFETHILSGNGFAILDWRALGEWAHTGAAEDAGEAISLGRRAWLLHLRDTMGSASLLQTRDAWVLSSYEPRVANTVAAYVGATRGRIARLLEGIAHFGPGERSIFVAFDSRDDYYRYVANYYPDEGEFAFSGGMYVNAGCPHFVTEQQDLWQLEPVIAHEMTHSALAHLELPLWLDEGIAVTTEQQIATHHHGHPRQAVELIGKHLQFWNAERIQEFWSGESFRRTDEGNELSYDLARNIVGLIGREWNSFTHFVTEADHADAGADSASAALALDLGELASAALNVAPQPGWSPDPAAWKHEGRQR